MFRIAIALVSACFLIACGPPATHSLNQSSDKLGPFLEPSIRASPQNLGLTNQTSTILYFDFSIDALLSKKEVRCKIDDRPAVDCRNGIFPLSGLSDGDHVITVSLTDSLGRKAEDLLTSIQVDTVLPTLQVTQQPGAFTGKRASFAFAGSDGQSGVFGLECRLNNLGYSPCTSPLTLDNLTNGPQSLRIRSRDRAGNVSAEAILNWTVNNSAPLIAISSRPPDNTTSRQASFTWSGTLDGQSVTEFRCSLDGQAFQTCQSPLQLTGLADGPHTLQIAGRNNNAEFINPSSVNWRVDNLPPTAPALTSNVTNPTTATAAMFMFTSTDAGSGVAGYRCSLDGAPFADCTSPVNLQGLAKGTHNFQVFAIDRAGNVSDGSSFAWTIN